MRVKRLEIQGFKSFKDKTVIHFDEGITGIVGPNGCGKSNIVDAFFWVMGEQSYKHMRGTGSEDLIFNGSSKYSPLGLAEATLVMETDVADTENAPAGASIADLPVHLRAKEVSVTRRLYRTGEGEYFINGVQARLKDIQELFMDTGVGAKGYSVIEQGQIGKVVNAKPEERRLLIEEAAGIAKYKARKKESLRKMEATEGNLSRLNDVVQEIERNLASLERQAQKARLYKKYKDELLDKELSWGRRKIQVIRQRLDALKKQREQLEQELLGLRTELQTTENALESDRTGQLSLSRAVEELQAQVAKLSDELTREQSALELSRRRRGDLASQLEALEAEKSGLEAAIEQETGRVSTMEDSARQADQAFEEARARAQTVEGEVSSLRSDASQASSRALSARRELMDFITRGSEQISRKATLAVQIEAAEAQAARVAQHATAQAARLDETRGEGERLRTAAESARQARQSKQTESDQLRQKVLEREAAHRQAIYARDESVKSLAQVRSRLQSLEELDCSYEGFGDGPRAALEWAKSTGQGSEILALADAFEVTPELETALSGWLENRLEALIAGSSQAALAAIEQLKKANQGRVAIHLASEGREVPDSSAPAEEIEDAGFQFLGTLAGKIGIKDSIPAALRDAASAMIDRVCVVASMAKLEKLINDGKLAELAGWSLVSLDGTAFHAIEGYLSGGALETDAGAGVLRRKRAISELKTQTQLAESAHAHAESEVARALKEVDATRAEVTELQAQVHQSEIELAATEREIQQNGRALREAESLLEEANLELTEARADAERAREQQTSIESELQGFDSGKAKLESEAAQAEQDLGSSDQAAREREQVLQSARVSEAELRERTIGLKRDLEARRALIADRERRLADIGKTLERASTEREQFSGGESALEERIATLTKTVADARGELSEVKDRLEQTGARITQALDGIKGLHKSGDEKAAEVNNLALELEKLAGEDQHLVQNLEEKYGPGCLDRPVTSPIQDEMTEPVVTAEMTAEEERELGEEVERLRERIRRLGEVNVMAIEEFEELKKRYDYLTGEKLDLERSIENLKDAIEHINKTSEERFKKAFEAIAERFAKLFPIVFGGGYAELSLVYPEGSVDVLDAGVDILAQPPGKKIQNITLLSGGEKALTAVSLIFAIFMVKPSPFCLLDEVDAPLDDANIGKFNALLREMSAKSQFILITHNKKTMELNDTLYGVTMEEPGVSKMISIQMQ